MARKEQRWATPDSTVKIEKGTTEGISIDAEDRDHLRRMKRRRRRIKALVVGSLVSVLALIALASIFEHYFIPSDSMEPTIAAGDRILANQLSYRTGEISRGDVVIVEIQAPGSSETFEAVQRVIGLPGETIEIVDGVVFLDGNQLEEPYLAEMFVQQFESTPIPEGQYFLMGDNRAAAADSRVSGPVAESDITARAVRIFWPFDRLAAL